MDSVQQAPDNPWETMNSEQLVSAMTLADREERYGDFRRYRSEIMYRLRCSEPLVNWSKPLRFGDEK